MTRYGHLASGAQRWRCFLCNISQVSRINSTAKHLDEFLSWLLSGRRQADLPGGGRSFRRCCEPLWQLWPVSPIIDEVHDVIFVDGIHLGRCAVVLIAQSPDHVLGWYAARSENSRAWGALMSRIAPRPWWSLTGAVGSRQHARRSGLPRASSAAPSMRIAVFAKPPRRAPNWWPRDAYTLLGNNSLRVEDPEDAQVWIGAYQAWCTRWKGFLEEKTRRPDGGWEYTHDRLVRARNSLSKLIRQGLLFTYLNPTWDHPMPSTTNQIESTNAQLRQMLRDHRGMRLTRRMKAVFWWCYTHSPRPQPAATILATMPTDAALKNAWYHASHTHQATATIPG